MLNNSQVEFLSKICDLDVYKYGDLIISVNNRKHKSAIIKHDYNDFKFNMGLSDLRFDWLLTDKIYLSGGCVLNWVWNENKNEDYDFFFTNPDSARNFRSLISNYGFEETSETKYALTCFNREEGLILQVIGGAGKEKKDEVFNGFIPHGTPEETINRFDINVCRFAVDGDNIYFTTSAVMDLINRVVKTTQDKYNTKERIVKYNQKGFYIPNPEAQPVVDTDGWY